MLATTLRVIRIVVCSPGDVARERELVRKVTTEINRHHAHSVGIDLQCVCWETDSYPAFHVDGPQGLIDPILQIEDSDIVIGIFWKRFGTPTLGVDSGTEHELQSAIEAWRRNSRPQVMVYFSEAPYSPASSAETDQWGKVLKFKEQFPKDGFWWPYLSADEFESLIRNQLHQFINQASKDDSQLPSTPSVDLLGAPSFNDLMSRVSLNDQMSDAIAHSPIVVFGGLSGTGKTYAVSDFVGAHYKSPGSVFWYDAEQGESIDRLFAELGPALGLSTQSTHSRCKELFAKLRERRGLLVIDNFHSVDLESYRPLLNSAARVSSPAVLLVITQRASTLLHAGPARHVQAEGFTLAELHAYASRRGLHGMTERMLGKLHSQTDGLPFAISLFATLVKVYDADPGELLSRGLRTDEAIDDWFDRIASLMDASALELLKFLSLMETPFNPGLVKVLAELGGIDQYETALRNLQRVYLIQRYGYNWKTHDLVAARCRELLPAETRSKAYARLSLHFMRGYKRRKPSDLLESDEFRWKSRALDQLVRSGDLLAVQALFQALVATAKATGRYAFVIAHGEMLRKQLPTRNPWIDYHCAHAYLICGATHQAFAIMDGLLREQDLEDATVNLACRRLRAEALFAMGRVADAHAALRAALVDPDVGKANANARAQALSIQGQIDIALGNRQQAYQTGERLLADAVRSDSERSAAVAFALMGTAIIGTDRGTDAIGYLKQANELFEKCSDRRGTAWTLAQLAECLLGIGDIDAAQARLLDAAHICANIGECTPDYQALLQRIGDQTRDPGILKVVAAERERMADWADALPQH